MRHRVDGRKLGRTTSHRESLFRNMATALFQYERIRSTEAKLKELRRIADKLITLAKRGDLHARRQVLKWIQNKEVVKKLFETIASRYAERQGGYTRLLKLGTRPGDAAPMALLELTERGIDLKKEKTKGEGAKEPREQPK